MPLITIEGLDGSGKSLQAERLRRFLEQQGLKVALFREPGGTSIGEEIREFIMQGRYSSVIEGSDDDGAPRVRLVQSMSPYTELMLFQASRAQLIAEQIAPKLSEDWVVILDRFICSSAVYQGWLGNIGMPRVLKACLVATQGIKPDATVFLDVDPQITIDRLNTRNDKNRFDTTDILQIKNTRNGYLRWYEEFCPYPYDIIDGNKSIQDVSNAILDTVWTNERIIPERIRERATT